MTCDRRPITSSTEGGSTVELNYIWSVVHSFSLCRFVSEWPVIEEAKSGQVIFWRWTSSQLMTDKKMMSWLDSIWRGANFI